jgi:hypothetical protein
MSRLPRWLQSRNNREILSFVGAGVAATVAAGWVLYKYSHEGSESLEATYQVCVSDKENGCPPGLKRHGPLQPISRGQDLVVEQRCQCRVIIDVWTAVPPRPLCLHSLPDLSEPRVARARSSA